MAKWKTITETIDVFDIPNGQRVTLVGANSGDLTGDVAGSNKLVVREDGRMQLFRQNDLDDTFEPVT